MFYGLCIFWAIVALKRALNKYIVAIHIGLFPTFCTRMHLFRTDEKKMTKSRLTR